MDDKLAQVLIDTSVYLCGQLGILCPDCKHKKNSCVKIMMMGKNEEIQLLMTQVCVNEIPQQLRKVPKYLTILDESKYRTVPWPSTRGPIRGIPDRPSVADYSIIWASQMNPEIDWVVTSDRVLTDPTRAEIYGPELAKWPELVSKSHERDFNVCSPVQFIKMIDEG